MSRGLAAVATLVVVIAGTSALGRGASGSAPSASSSAGGALAVGTVVDYSAPVTVPLRVLRAFAPPLTRYGPGHRGVDLDAGAGGVVTAAAVGRVSFAGSVAGRGVVVLVHPDGIRTEYEPVRPLVRVGASVRPGQVIGTVSGTHRGCAAAGCLHWGARRGDVYVDPLALLHGLGPVRLLPWTGPP